MRILIVAAVLRGRRRAGEQGAEREAGKKAGEHSHNGYLPKAKALNKL